MTIFLAMQIAANLIFKYGSMAPSRFVACFVVGNVIGASSIFFLMRLYERMNANVAMAIGGGATFLIVQFALATVFSSRLSTGQWFGIAAVGIGMAATALSAAPAAR
jgi:multidrug transporter EmrE-like cation transporter